MPVRAKKTRQNKALVPAFGKFMVDQSDKLGVIVASISLIDAAVNCRHGAKVIAL
jgi:hypothetical protein